MLEVKDNQAGSTLKDGRCLVARGLDGQNLLAFLAALGTLQVLSDELPEARARLSWNAGLHWTPAFHLAGSLTEKEVLEGLQAALAARKEAPELTGLGDDLTATGEAFRDFVGELRQTAGPGNRRGVDFAAGLGSEAYATEKGIQDTAFRTMSGAGHQHFLKTMRELLGVVEVKHLEAALLHPWRYENQRLSLRWDPADDRRYALRAGDPSKDTSRTQWGANALATFALSLYPCAIQGARVETTGFKGRLFRWPVWREALPLEVVRSLLGHAGLWEEDREVLEGLGIAAVFQTQRLSVGKFRSFSPSRAVFVGRGR